MARHLLSEVEENSRRCHDCQRYEWAKGENPPCAQCERYQLYRQCRECDECTSWYILLSKWRKSRRQKLEKKGVAPEEIDERMRQSLRKRISTIDLRPSSRRRTKPPDGDKAGQ